MKMFVLFCLSFLLNINIADVRKLYPKSADSQENAQSFLSKLSAVDDSSGPLLNCYKGAAIAMQSKFLKTVKDKKAMLRKGTAIVESALAEDPENIELHMIRLSIQESLPKIVGYSMNIEQDRKFIISNLSKTAPPVKLYILEYVMQSKSFSKAQREAMVR